MVDEGSRCPFLLENDDSKLVTCMCNYYSLGQAELARALLRIVASRSLARALRIVKTIIWHGPPKHWLCSVFAPSSAHVTWMCLIDFQDLVETHMKRPAQLPPWLLKRLEFDVLIAQALLDGAAIQAQALTAEVASELRAYHAGLLCATGQEEDLPPEMQVPYSFKLPALSLLQVTNQVSPYVNFLPAHTTDRHEQVDHLASGNASLSKAAVQQLYDLCKSQPLLGRCVGRALAPPGCAAALTTARRIQQMCLGLTADSLLQSLKGDAWRYLKFLEVSDAIGSPQPLLELFSVLLVVVVSDIRPTPALHARLQGLVSMATSTLSATAATGAGPSVAADSGASVVGNLASAVVGSGVVGTGAVGAGVGPGTLGGPSAPPGTLGAQEAGGGPPEGGEGDGGAPATGPDGPHLGAQAGPAGVAVTGSTAGASTAAAARTLAEIFAQALPAEGGTGTKPWEHLRQLLAARTRGAAEEAYGAAGAGGGAAARSSAHRFSKFLNRIRGEKSIEDDALQEDLGAAPRGSDGGRHQFHSEGANGAEGGGGQPGGVAWQAAGDRPRAKAELSAVSVGGADGWDADGPAEAARNAFLHRTQIYEALLTHESGAGGTQTALRLFSVLEDELLRLKAAQSPLPPAFELLEPSDADAYLFKAPPITFWDAYFEFVRVAGVHCLEYVVHAAVKFIRQHDFCAAAWLLAPFPQLKPLVVLLCWPEFDGDVGSRQSLLDTLWKSYTEETREDPSRTGDQLVDHWVEVLNYRLSVSWWISKLKEDSRSAQGQAELEKLPGYRASAHERGGGPGARRKEPAPPSAGVGAAQEQGSEPDARPLALVAADVLNRVKSHSILYVMRPDLPMVESHTLLSALQSLPPLRQAAAAMEHSYDLDLARCYYTVRCATYLVERCVPAAGAKAVSFDSVMPGRQVIEEGMNELNRLISSIERTPLKVSIFLIISSLCFMRRRYLQHDGTMRGSAAAAQPPPSGAEAASDFLVPPGVMLSLLALLRHHLQALVAQEGTSDGLPEASAEQLRGIIRNLFQFTQETIWRIFISLKDFFTHSQLTSAEGSMQLRPTRRAGLTSIAEDNAAEWAHAVGAVIVGEVCLEEFFEEMSRRGDRGFAPDASAAGAASASASVEAGKAADHGDHPLEQFCTPMETPLSQHPSTFVPRMLSDPETLLHRSLKMNDYLLGRRLLQHFPSLRGAPIESTVRIAEKFKDLRQGLSNSHRDSDLDEALSDEQLDEQLGPETFGRDIQELVSAIQRVSGAAPGAGQHPRDQELAMLLSLSGPLLEFYVHVDLAISAAPFSQLSTHLLKKGSPCLASEGLASVGDPGLLPITASLRSFFKNWVERLQVLVEVRPAEFKGRASLASIILGIETLPSEPALLKSHLNRMHSQRHAILSLVESVDLVKKGQTTSTSQRTLVDFLSSAIKSLTSEEDESSKATVTDVDARDQRDDAEAMAEGLGASKYLLRFLEYLAKVADLMRSASTDAQARKTKKTQEVKKHKPKEGHIKLAMNAAAEDRAGEGSCDGLGELPEEDVEVTKLFDVLAESPKGIVARLLFELGGHRQALALSEVMNVDLVQVIVNSSAVLPVWTPQRGEAEGHRLRDPGTARSRYPLSMEVVHYLAQHETALPQVRCPEAPLLATMACLERRGKRWPSWKMLHFAKGQSDGRFPSLHRWAEERCHALRAIQWADERTKGPREPRARAPKSPPRRPASARTPPPSPSSVLDELSASSGPEQAGEGCEDEDEDGGAGFGPAVSSGYSEEQMQRLGVEDRLALEAVGDDHEAGMSAAYTKLVHALNTEQRYEEALQVCDEYLPFDSALTDQVLHLYLNSTHGDEAREPTPFVARAELLDHECMHRLKRHTLAARLTLERHKRWDVDTAVQTVSMCLQRFELQPSTDGTEVHSLKLELKRILRKMVTFEKILQVSGGRWRVWQEIEDMDKAQVSEAVAHLMSLEQHDLARTLTQMYGMTDPLHSLELSRLHYLFTTKNDKTSAVSRLLSFPPQQAVSFALQLLDMFDLIQHRVLLCQMLLERLHSWLSADEDQRLRVLHAALQLLGAVSDTVQPHFLRVLRKPVLIVESLLMNARVDLLEPFLADFPQYRHDALILRYARKALALQAAALLCLPAEDEEASLSPLEDGRVPGAAAGVGAADCAGTGLGGKWCLTGSPSEDRRIREEHVFEAAPSIGLAEQILELCSDSPENAASCFAICDELSLRLRDLAPHHSLGPPRWERGVRSEDAVRDGGGGPCAGAAGGSGGGGPDQGAPLSSVRLVTFLIRRLLVYLQGKFRNAGGEVQVQLERSLNNLDFIPTVWQATGLKVGLSHLCDPERAARLRDQLIAEDQLSIALELCERCGGERKSAAGDSPHTGSAYGKGDSTWRISADPVREAKAVALQKLHRYGEARQEFGQTQSADAHATKTALGSFEHSMRYPPLFDLSSMEHLHSLYTFNSLQRKLYRSTSTLASLPIFLLPSGAKYSAGATDAPLHAGKVAGAQREPGSNSELELTKLPVPPVPVIPLGHPPDRPRSGTASTGLGSWGALSSGAGLGGGPEAAASALASSQGAVQLSVLEQRLQDSVRCMKKRRQSSAEEPPSGDTLDSLGSSGGLGVSAGSASPAGGTVSSGAGGTAAAPAPGASLLDVADTSRGPDAHTETLFVNGVTFLCPPIHPPEMPSWSTLQDLPRVGKGGKAHPSKEGALAEAPPEADVQAEDKERMPEEVATAGEAEADGEKGREDEGEEDAPPAISYDRLMMDVTDICCGCSSASLNLRSQSNLWPEDNHTHSLMPASPMALPLALPLVFGKTGERRLSEASFNELLHYQENYGTAESLLSMLVRERRLSQACCYIFNEKVSKRLFVDVVAHHCLAHNQFAELQKVILDFDPSLRRVQEYLNVLKEFLRDRRALDLLYSYQVFTKDFVNAGLLAIQLFIASNTWDARVGHLQNAYAHLNVAYKQLFGRRRGAHADHKGEGGVVDGAAEGGTMAGAPDGALGGGTGETMVDGISGLEITESDICRSLETVKIQMAICEAMPTDMPQGMDLFGPTPSQCEVAERLLVAAHFDLAQRVIDFLDLPAVELCVRASNQIATLEARKENGSIARVVRFLESIPKVPPMEWDSLVSNVVNIWIIEKAEISSDPSAAGQLIRFIRDERCQMDAHILTGNLASALQIATRLGSLHDVLHIRARAQKVGDLELQKQISSFLAYTSPGLAS